MVDDNWAVGTPHHTLVRIVVRQAGGMPRHPIDLVLRPRNGWAIRWTTAERAALDAALRKFLAWP